VGFSGGSERGELHGRELECRAVPWGDFDHLLWTHLVDHLWTICRATPRNARRPVTTLLTSIL